MRKEVIFWRQKQIQHGRHQNALAMQRAQIVPHQKAQQRKAQQARVLQIKAPLRGHRRKLQRRLEIVRENQQNKVHLFVMKLNWCYYLHLLYCQR